jgi:hypothetical protein
LSERYRVPKYKTQVEIRYAEGQVRRVGLFLAEFSDHRLGPERADDVLNGERDFLAIESESGEIGFVRRHAIALVTLGKEEDADELLGAFDPIAADLDTQVSLCITLRDGTELTGQTRYQQPEAHSRLVDFLNAAPAFIPLRHDGRLSLVNKQHISSVMLG